MNRKQNLEVFAKTPVRKAVLLQIVPAVASQMVTLVYNLADTYFVGMLNAPHETAAVTVAYPSFLMLTAISNLFGVGGASAIARALGRQDEEGARRIAAVSLAGGLLSALLFSAAFRLLADPVLHLCGATEATYATAYGYAKWVVILGGPFTILNTLLANLVRAEGGAGAAAFGVSFGGVLNILLDPLFVLPQFLGLGAVGAGMATALSNGAAVACFAVYLVRRRGATYLNLLPANLRYAAQYLRPILAIGFPSALQYALTVVATAAQADFVSQYPTEAVAALGIVKKLDQLPLYFSIGVSNGLLPLLAYNHAAGNHHRRAQAFRIGSLMSFGFAVLCLVCYEAFATPLVSLFIADAATVRYGAVFLRCMVTAMPMMALCYPMIIQFQAMGRARESLVCSILRKAAEAGIDFGGAATADYLREEIDLVKSLTEYPSVVKSAGENFAPSVVGAYVYELAKQFNGYYHDHSILKEENADIRRMRLQLVQQVARVIKEGMKLLGIDVPERM